MSLAEVTHYLKSIGRSILRTAAPVFNSKLINGRAHPRRSPIKKSHLPPVEVVKSLVNTYFSRIQNQPYAFFHPGTFQQRLDRDSIPRCLLFAVLAMAVRFTDHSYFQGNVQEASDAYSRRSWLHVIDDYLTVDDKLDLALIQTVSLLALVDYTGKYKSSNAARNFPLNITRLFCVPCPSLLLLLPHP